MPGAITALDSEIICFYGNVQDPKMDPYVVLLLLEAKYLKSALIYLCVLVKSLRRNESGTGYLELTYSKIRHITLKKNEVGKSKRSLVLTKAAFIRLKMW